MATNFPTSLDTLTNPTSSNKLSDVGVLHTDQHANANDAIEALQAKVGINGSAVTSSLDYLITQKSPLAGSSSITTLGTIGTGVWQGTAVGLAYGGTGKTTASSAMANLMGYTSTATAAGTTVLTNASSYYQQFTGTSTQTITLPVTSTLQAGWTFHIVNNSTGNLTINSSGGNLVITVIPNTTAMVTCIGTTLTTAADWESGLTDFSLYTGTGSVVMSASPTFTGVPLSTTAAVDTNTTQIATTAYVIGQSYLKTTTASSTYAPIASPTFTGGVILPTGSTSNAPIKFVSGTNLTTPTAGSMEFDGTILNFTPNTNFGRASLQTTVYTSGTGISLTPTATGETTAQALFPAANDTITLPIGTYYIQLTTTVTRGATSTTSATARINLGGAGTAVGSFSGDAISSIAAGGATSQFSFNATALTVDNVVTAANTTASGVYNINMSGILRITTAGTIIPKYSLSAALTGATTATSPSSATFMKIDAMNSSGSAASNGGWA